MSSVSQFGLQHLEGRRLFSMILEISPDSGGLADDAAPPAADSSSGDTSDTTSDPTTDPTGDPVATDPATTDDGSGVAEPTFHIMNYGATNEGGQGGLVDLGSGQIVGLGGVHTNTTGGSHHHKHHGKGLTQFKHPPKPSKASKATGFTSAKHGFGLMRMFSGVLIS